MEEVFLVFLWRNVLGVFRTQEDARDFIETEPSMTDGERAMCVVDRWPVSGR